MSQRIYYSEAAQRTAERQQLILAMAVAGVSLSLGAIIALLFASDKGEDIRHEIRAQLDDLLERGSESSRQMAEDVRDNAERMRDNVEDRIKAARR